MTRVVMIQDVISNYNVPVFNYIAQRVDFTIMYFYGGVPENVKFKTIKTSIDKLDQAYNYDILVCCPNFSHLSFLKLIKKFGRKKTIYYGIGVSASYKHHYDKNPFISFAFSFFLKWIGAAIFYCDYPKTKYSKMGVKNEKMFVANNTVEVIKTNIDNLKKENILFIGSLYKEKGIFILLEAYRKATIIEKNVPNLIIVGDGEEKSKIESYLLNNELNKKISLLGSIYDEDELCNIFRKTIACISPNQAGLSVLKSQGYGVPFVTNVNSITGGEIFNINDENGIVYKKDEELVEIIVDIARNKQKYHNLGKNAYNHYYSKCKVSDMGNGFIDAFTYICKINREI